MVTETPDILRVWWNNLKDCQKREILIHLGHLPSIIDFKVWPTLIEVITRFWDAKRMVFQFGDVEIYPKIEEIKDCLDSIGTCGKRIKYPDHHILLPDRPTSAKLKDMLLLVNADCWMLKIYH